jgi:aconitate hydratase
MWNEIEVSGGDLYAWGETSTYIQHPPFFKEVTPESPSIEDIKGARVLGLFGDSITTDHISPAGAIAADSPAGKYLQENDIKPRDFNSYGSRRGNDQVMARGTFGNIRLKNQLVTPKEGNWTMHLPSGEIMPVFDAAVRYRNERVPSIIIAGKEYGTGSSRDWAAKGPLLQGVKAVIAESFERIHRSNLVGMGILPLQFVDNQNAESLGLKGDEVFDIECLRNEMPPRGRVNVRVHRRDGRVDMFEAQAMLNTEVEVEYFRNGGILHTVLRNMVR